MRPIYGVIVGLLVAAALAAPCSAAEAPTRPEYVKRLEKICRPGSKAAERAVRGVKADIRSEHLRRAAPKVAKAKDIFAHTVSTIGQVTRPEADRATLVRWFTGLRREAAALGQTAEALRASDVARFQHVWSDFVHEGAKANNIVVSFGFNFCAFRSSRFE